MAMEEVIIRLGVDSSGFVRVLDQANAKIDEAGAFVDKLGSKLATVLSVAALTNLAKQAIQYASDMNDAADATRTGVEEYQVLAQAARDSGASLQQLDQALIKSTLSGEKAAEGNKEMSAAFRTLNIDVEKFNALPTEKKLESIGSAYNAAGGSQEAYNAICEILGTKSAPRLIAALQTLGSEGFDAVRAKAEEAGVVLSKLDAQRLDNLSDQMQTWKVRGLVVIGEMIQGFQKIAATIAGFVEGKSFTQIVNEDLDPERIKVRMDAIAQLVAEGVLKIQEAIRGPEGEIVVNETLVATKQGADAIALVEQRINDILNARRTTEAETVASKQQQTATTERQAEVEASNLATANAIKIVEDGRRILRLKEMTDKERLVALSAEHAEAEEIYNNMLLLGEGTEKEKEAIAKRVRDIEAEIAATKSKIDAETRDAAEDRKKKQEELLELIKEEAALQAAITQDMYNRYGRSATDIAAGGGGSQNSTLGRLATDAQRLTETAQRQFDEVARRRAALGNVEEGSSAYEASLRDLEGAEARLAETEARRQGLEERVAEYQGGKTGDPVVDKLEDVRQEIEEMREDLGAA